MDEAEQLCDRLVVMDKAKIVAEGSPRQLIERYSTPEVIELRFREEIRAQLDGKLDGVRSHSTERSRDGSATRILGRELRASMLMVCSKRRLSTRIRRSAKDKLFSTRRPRSLREPTHSRSR